MIRIVADEKIPFLKGVLEPYARVHYLPGQAISRKELTDADALVIRTRTHCNEALLQGSALKFIATATIGFDHIDQASCRKQGIAWANAPGCNSSSVMQYMGSVLAHLALETGTDLQQQVLGIIGVGHVGSKVDRLARILGIKTLLYDPPRAREEGPSGFCELEDIFREATLLSFHVPLNREGQDKTWHMGNRAFFNRMQHPFTLVNTSRGEVIESAAIREGLESGRIVHAILDVWEKEPDADPWLLQKALLATPHIAGYSTEGKANGTSMAVQALANFFGLPLKDWYPSSLPPPARPGILIQGSSVNEVLYHILLSSYPVAEDSLRLKADPARFEQFRGEYPVRREYGAFHIEKASLPAELNEKIIQLGYQLI